MVKTLQKKFIFASMMAITILIVILLGTVNVVNIIRQNNHNENLMEMLSGGDRMFKNEEFGERLEDFTPGGNTNVDITPKGDANGDLTLEGNDAGEFTSEGNAIGDFTPEGNDAGEFTSEGNATGDFTPEGNDAGEFTSEENDAGDLTPEGNDGEFNPEGNDSDNYNPEENNLKEDEAENNNSTYIGTEENREDTGKEADNYRNDRKNFHLFDPVLNEDDRLSAVYFVVRLDENDEVIYTDVSNISSVDEETATDYASQVLKKNKEKGKIDGYKYVVSYAPDGRGKTVVFLDIKSASQSILAVALVSVGIGLLCWISMLLLIIALSKKAIRPIASNIERQKQFITDAGHEIKTPLAIILANTDAMELHNGESKWSKNIRKQTTRLSELMQRMLSLAKMDEGTAKLKFEDIDISKLVNESATSFKESAKQKNLTIEKEIEDNVICKADKESMTQLINILTDNAVKYADESSTIKLKLKKHDKHMKFSISNTCSNLPDVPPEKMFDRFYKGDSARTQKSGGFGIGLSVAQAVVESHKGIIKATYPSDNTIKFEVEI